MTVALVTGATKNIGYAIASALAAQGITVALNGRDEAVVGEAVERLSATGATVLPAVGDIASEQGVAALVDDLLGRVPQVDILVNNAGIRAHGPLVDTDLADWQAVLDTVLTGAFLTTRALLGGMCDRGWGRIVNIAGVSGQSGAANRPSVVAAKSGLIGLTKATAHEAAARGVTVNAVSPGLIDTQRSATRGDHAVADAHYKQMAAAVPLQRQGKPEEVGALCAFLCSDAAGFITGQVYGINGGVYM
ncbi:SDR family NAD(P)-dependent oxidoreductase [Blastococcus saxobsidens]|uniref:Acetoacetyl-CoA reductase/3-oxoacyl-[acyl-carrier protein] reductase n=1 Tax=Blastococcus saxobsidens TaxID=138336 RepID=A0A4Q7YCC8_9ACTN|nr:SDR family oxidoreductase [Blastococcus saxobsidens]RZU34163.1 acetoacetyl-CoA reductase/3-oxoacyl-[acyl-carrier protein] reductase [Blastococcus saxobsidens]